MENINITSNEIWKTVPEYSDYLISNHGNFKSLKHNQVKTLKTYFVGNKVLVILTKAGIQKTFTVSRLVAQTFLNYDFTSNLVVHCKDRNNKNVSAENLEIITFRQTFQKKENKSSKYVGVHSAPFGGFRSQIRINGKIKDLGRFETELEAHNAYQNMLKSF